MGSFFFHSQYCPHQTVENSRYFWYPWWIPISIVLSRCIIKLMDVVAVYSKKLYREKVQTLPYINLALSVAIQVVYAIWLRSS